jgi:hypothetical protein
MTTTWCSTETTYFDRSDASKSLNHQRGLPELIGREYRLLG